MTSSPTDTQTCPDAALHGNPFRYCPTKGCGWIEEAPTPAPNDALGELTTLILGKTATGAAKAVLDAGYRKVPVEDTTPCCGASEACRDCPTD